MLPRLAGVRVLVVDGANVVGSRPTGWWRDRAGAARSLHASLAAADPGNGLGHDLVVLVLEGAGRGGQAEGRQGRLETVHAKGSGDDAIVQQVAAHRRAGAEVVVVTADRELRRRVAASGGSCIGPSWLHDRLAGGGVA